MDPTNDHVQQPCLTPGLRPGCWQWSVLSCVILLLTLHSGDGRADEAESDSLAVERLAAVELHVQKIDVRDVPAMNVLRNEVGIQIRLNNRLSAPLAISRDQISLLANGAAARLRTTAPLGKSRTLAPQESVTFTAMFDVQYPPAREPDLKLRWKQGERLIEIDVNQLLRRPETLQTSFLGPDQGLAVVELNRPLDHLMIWVLNEELQRLKARNVQRLVLDIRAAASATSSFALRTTIGGWLSSLRRGQPARRFVFGMRLQAPVKFDVFYFCWTGVKPSRIGSSAIAGDVLQPSREQAIARALQTAYNRIPVQQALADLRHPEPGVRRAALEANIDRLTMSELKSLIEQAQPESESTLLLIAENLHRVSHPQVVQQLFEFANVDNPALVEAAIQALVKSPAEGTVALVRKLWQQWEASPDQQRVLAEAILDSGDHRYAEQILLHAATLLDQFSRPDKEAERLAEEERSRSRPGREENADQPEAEVTFEVPRASTSDVRKLRIVLQYLARHAPDELQVLSRRKVLHIAEPSVQDSVMQHILADRTHSDRRIVRAYIQQRLPEAVTSSGSSDDSDEQSVLSDQQKEDLTSRLGPRGGSPRSRITRDLMKTIRSFPNTEYTERLLMLSKSKAVSGNVRSEAFQSAVACASSQQLDAIIDGAGQNTSGQNNFLIRHLHQHQHPAWLKVARLCLEGEESEQALAVPMLVTSGSTQALELVIDRLESLQLLAEQEDGLSASDFRLAKKILNAVAAAGYPEARRAINRCTKSSDLSLAREAHNSVRAALQSFARTTPYSEQISRLYQLRREKKYADAIAVLNEVLENEPFFHSGFVSRGSMLMRLDQHEAALADLERALELDPEDPTTEAITAIALVRVGQVEAGITRVNKLLAQIPDLPTTVKRDALYNAACVYARAVQETDDQSTAARYLDKGLELLTESVTREGGFGELQHFLNDDDLQAFHDDERWPGLVEQVRENEQNRPAP